MDYKAKFAEVHVKKVDKSSLNIHVHHNSEHVNLAISGAGRPQEKGIFRFLIFHKENSILSKLKNFFHRSSLHKI